nr:MAG TPA: hypothetical protein [Caudoviricetes sp.]
MNLSFNFLTSMQLYYHKKFTKSTKIYLTLFT